MTLDHTADRARGYMLLAIFYMHSLFAFANTREPEAIMASFVQIKLLSPHVAVFFLLSGMSAQAIGRRNLSQIAGQAAALVLLAIASHVSGFLLMALLHGTGTDLAGSIRMLVWPIILGTGYSTYVAWFFLPLAMSRVLACLFYRRRIIFALVVAGLAALIVLSQRLGLPDNLWEWRTWPPALVLFLIGTRMPRRLAVPLPLGLLAALGSLVLTWFNRPGVLWQGPCLRCDLTFVSQPMVGQFGSIPVFLAQELLFLMFILSLSQLVRPSLPPRLAQLVGRNSVQFLLLNGWVMVALNPWMLPLLPAGDSLLLFIGLLVGGALVHLALYVPLKRPLDKMILVSFRSIDRLFGMHPFTRHLPLARQDAAK